MNDSDSAELLERFVLNRDDDAFAQLVRRYAGLVRGTALRVSGGRIDLAEEAAQSVFLQLARKAPRLLPRPRLGGWLHEVTCTTTLGFLRAEKRRRHRESTAHAQQLAEAMPTDDTLWQEIAPHLDGCLRSLGSSDREVLTGRYLEGKSTRDLAADLQLTPEAVQKRITRALDRLRRQFGRRGVSLTAAALMMSFSNRSEAAVPEEVAQQWMTHALSACPRATSISVWARVRQTILGDRWAFLGGVAMVAVLSVAASTVMRDARDGESVASAAGWARRVAAPPLPGRIPRDAEREDPFRQMVAAARERDPLTREWRLDAAFVPITPALAHRFILRGESEFDLHLQKTLFPRLFAAWAEAEPTAAMDYALSSGIDTRLAGPSMGFVYSLVWKWIERDRNAVGDWLVRHWSDGGFHRGTLQGGMGSELALALAASWTREGEVSAALTFLERLPAGPHREAALAGVADDGFGRFRMDWPADRQAEMMTVLAARADGPLGADPLRRSLAVWAQYHPEEARRFIDGLRDPKLRFNSELAWLSIAREWILVLKDAESGRSTHTSKAVTDRPERADRALQAAQPLPTGTALVAIVENWADPKAACEWLRSLKHRLPVGEADEAFARTAVGMVSKFGSFSRDESDLQTAFQIMSEEISDLRLREDSISGLARWWIAVSPQQAEKFLANADWPAERLDRLRPLVTRSAPLPR